MLQAFYSFVEKLPLYHSSAWLKICFFVGFLAIFCRAFKIAKGIWYLFFLAEYNLIERYGENSYAVITGASDGIGKAFCFALARRGFNIVLIARNKAKLDGVAQEIKKEYPSIATKVIVADFAFCTKETFFTDIVNMLQGLDISILVNNVGVGKAGFYAKKSEEDIRETILINCLPQAILSKHILPKLNSRKTKSAIINLSSFSCTFPMPYMNVYAATKSFNDYLSKSLSMENPKLDILSVKPGFVATQMLQGHPDQLKKAVPAESSVDSILRDLGHCNETYGHKRHYFLYLLSTSVPTFLRDWMTRKSLPGEKKGSESTTAKTDDSGESKKNELPKQAKSELSKQYAMLDSDSEDEKTKKHK